MIFFQDSSFQPQSEFIKKLKSTMANLKPVPFHNHSSQKTFVFKDLRTCSHVFVRTDSSHRSLQQPFHGPYKVERRTDKVFTLKINQKKVNVSVDRLKPCFYENSTEPDLINGTPAIVKKDSVSVPHIGKAGTPSTKQVISDKRVRFASPKLVTRSGRSVHIPSRYK